jgi:hypothetical protein
VGRAVPFLPHPDRGLCVGLLPIYRTQSGACGHGDEAAGLSLVQLPRQCAGQGESLLITAHDEYGRLGRNDDARRAAYRALFKAHLDEEIIGQIRNATNGNYALGGERFQREIETALGRRARRGQAGRPGNNSIAQENQLDLL